MSEPSTARAPDPPFAPKIPLTWAELLRPGRRAVARYWRPFVLIQLGALAAVIAYFKIPAAAAVFEKLSDLKAASGLLGAAVAGGLAGVLLPEFAKTIALGERRFDAERLRTMAFHLTFFAFNGLVVDLFYRLLTLLLGDTQTPAVVVPKMAIDQLLFTPFWALPFGATFFAWRAHRYDARALWRVIDWDWIKRHIVPLLPPNWCYWVPMSCLIYSLPSKLQFVLFLFAIGAWSLVLVFIASGENETDPAIDPEIVPAVEAPGAVGTEE